MVCRPPSKVGYSPDRLVLKTPYSRPHRYAVARFPTPLMPPSFPYNHYLTNLQARGLLPGRAGRHHRRYRWPHGCSIHLVFPRRQRPIKHLMLKR